MKSALSYFTYRADVILVSVFCLCLHVDPAKGQDKTLRPLPEISKLQVAFTALAGNMAPLWVAAERNYFRENKLAVDQIYTRTITGIQALLAGDVQIIYAGCAQVMSARRAGADVVLIASTSHYNPYALVSRTGFSEPRQLIGKRVAVNQLKDATHVSARFALREIGLDPDSVVYVPIGSTPERLIALKRGIVEAAIYGGPLEVVINEGMTVLVDLFARKLPYCGGGIGLSEKFLKGNRITVESFMRAFLKGNAYYFDGDPEVVKVILAKFMRLEAKDRRVDQIYTHYRSNAKYPMVTKEGIAATVEILAHQDPTWSKLGPNQFYDNGMMDKLQADGFLDNVYRQVR